MYVVVNHYLFCSTEIRVDLLSAGASLEGLLVICRLTINLFVTGLRTPCFKFAIKSRAGHPLRKMKTLLITTQSAPLSGPFAASDPVV